jgi:hypothetical protein
MDKKQTIAIIGAIVLFLGVFAPIVSVPFLGDINYFHNGEGDGVILLVLAAATVPLALVKLYRSFWLTGGGSLAVLAFTFVNFQSKMTELRSSMEKDLAGNPFAGLGQAALGSIQLQWGWAVLVIGACLVIAAAIVREGSTEDEAQRPQADERKCPFCAEIILSEAKICRFCKSEVECRATIASVAPMPEAQGSAKEPTPLPSVLLATSAKKSTAFIVVLAVAVLAVVGLLYWRFGASPVSQTVKWTATSHTASAITGDVVTSRNSISLLNRSYQLVLVRDLRGDELQNSAKLLSVDAVASSSIEGRLFRTSIPATARLIDGNTICGSDSAEWVLALTTHAEGTGSDAGGWLYLAFFSGNTEPLLQTLALENSKALCGTYNYQKGAQSQPTASSDSSIDHIEKTGKDMDIPASLRGRWKILRSLKGVGGVTCMADEGESTVVGRSIEYTANSINWNGLITQKATAKMLEVTNRQYTESYRVDLNSLGIKSRRVTVIEIAHPDAKVIDCTTQIPGDTVMFKNRDTIIIWVDNNYFEAARQQNT